jgi:hypothetical protein
MTDPYRALRRSLHRGRRLTALALIALQGAIALSPLWERSSEGRLAAHTEQDGARHVGLHNEETCIVCAVRTLHAAAAARTFDFVTAPRMLVAASVAPLAIRAREPARSKLSRAPPLSG